MLKALFNSNEVRTKGLLKNYQKEGKRNQQTHQGPSPSPTPPPLQQQQAGNVQQPFHVTFLEKAVECYGRQRPFGTQMKKVPENIILKELDFREYTDKNGTTTRSTLLQNTFYHLNLDCIRRKYPMRSRPTSSYTELSRIIIHEEIRDEMTKEHAQNTNKFEMRI